MERIDLHNYEAFLLDYLEGNLEASLCDELKLFALTHPELEIDLDEQSLPTFAAEELEADFKMQLKKTELDFPDEVLLNYLDNNLPAQEQKAIEAKLFADKELAAEFRMLKKTVSVADMSVIFENKTALLKTEDDLVLNNRVLAYFENELSTIEKTGFEAELKSSSGLQKELDLISKTKLKADEAVIYPFKNELKKENKIIALFGIRTVAAMAAAVLLLFGLGFVFNYYTSGVGTKPNLAKKEIPAVKRNNAKKTTVTPPQTDNVVKPQPAQAQSVLASLSSKPVKVSPKNVLQKDSASMINQAYNPVAENKDLRSPEPKKETGLEKKLTIHEQIAGNQSLTMHDSLILEENVQQTVLLTLEETDVDTDKAAQSKHGFWKKAVWLARHANHLGVTAVDGNESGNKNYSLSFNSFSVEKR